MTQIETMNSTREEVPSTTAQSPRPSGFAILFTGLSGAGKSSIAELVIDHLQVQGKRTVTFLDGDVVRTHLCAGLGFSREDRATNIHRVAYVAAEIVKHGGIAVCAVIAPYADARAAMRNAISREGSFYEVYVNTPLEVCEARDVKGLYAQARSGRIQSFTGISDPYEEPLRPDLKVDGSEGFPEDSAASIIEFLTRASAIKAS
jgi:sulfate adenylyltransferase